MKVQKFGNVFQNSKKKNNKSYHHEFKLQTRQTLQTHLISYISDMILKFIYINNRFV